MSLLDDLLGALGGSDRQDFTPPTTLCPGECPIGPAACAQCRPYKEKLKEALYNVDHLEELLARYEVTGTASAGTTTCPHCGAPSADPFRCEYCGMQLREDDGKIRVASANDIPDPILEAQNIIFERHNAILGQVSQESAGGDLLSGLLDLLGGGECAGNDLGARMSKEEIAQAAQAYGVSVSTYLNGLDNGVYLSLAAKRQSDAASCYTGGGVGGVGLGGALFGAAASSMLRGTGQSAGLRGRMEQPPRGSVRREPPRPEGPGRQGATPPQRPPMPGGEFIRQGGGRAAAPQQRAGAEQRPQPAPQRPGALPRQAAQAQNAAPQRKAAPTGNAPGGGRRSPAGQREAAKNDRKSHREGRRPD